MGQKVLVFESDANFAGELRNELTKLGCSVSVVDDGNTGLQQATSSKPDLILLSIELPRMNGFSVCNKLKKDPSLKDIPLIIMSSESSDETFEQHRKLRTRAEDYVHKPIVFGELLARIQPFVLLGPPPSLSASPPPPVSMGREELEDADILVEDMTSKPPSGGGDEIGGDESTKQYDAFSNGGNGQVSIGEALQAPPPKMTVKSAPPPARNDAAAEELTNALARIRELEEEIDRSRRETEDVRARLSAPPAAGKVSSKEFLDLREQLNKKDKEILALKENLGKKDKEIVEAREKALALERQKSELDDKVLEQERKEAELDEQIEALTADKDQAKKAGEDFKKRAERAQQEADTRTKEIVELKQRHMEEAARQDAEHAQRLEAARTEKEEALAAAAAQADEQRAREVAESVATAVEAAKAAADEERSAALASTQAMLKQEHDGKLGALHRAHQEEANKLRAAHQEETNALRAEHGSALEALGKKHEEDKTNALEELATALEAERDQKIAAIEAAAAEKVRNLDVRVSEAEGELAATKTVLGEREGTIAEREATIAEREATIAERDAAINAQSDQIAALTESRNGIEKEMRSTQDRMVVLEADLAATKQTMDETRRELEQKSSALGRLAAKVEADKATLSRAKDAMAIALQQIEEAETRDA